MIQHVPKLQVLGIVSSECFQLLAQENVVLRTIGVDQTDLSHVRVVFADCSNELIHQCDAGFSCNHANRLTEALAVFHCAFRNAEEHLVAFFEVCEILARKQTVGVALDHEFQSSQVQVI